MDLMRLLGRLREQARSHMGLCEHRKTSVGASLLAMGATRYQP
ncbi:hypothetical protein J2X84_004463 [Pseudomonas corrugata]|nr:hypothetical protein [Pseudomonas corrugata]